MQIDAAKASRRFVARLKKARPDGDAAGRVRNDRFFTGEAPTGRWTAKVHRRQWVAATVEKVQRIRSALSPPARQ